MPRTTSSTSGSVKSTPLALSELHIRLEALDKEHQSLLKQIKRKRTELKNFVEKMRSLATEIFQRATPSLNKMTDLDREIHALFEEIFATRKFGKQTEKNIQAVYRKLQLAGIISPKRDRELEEPELDELFENFQQDNNFSQGAEQDYQNWRGQQGFSSSAEINKDESRKIRQTFLKLAEIFHPDKVKDSETQMYHTEIMKEINKAYQEGDLARLLEIEKQHEVGEYIDNNNEDDLTRKCKTLEQQNQILKNQYENLKRELRQAKNTPEGAMVSDSRKAAKQGIDSIDMMLETIEAQMTIVTQIRDFVQDFKEEKITIKEFLGGPAVLHSLNQEMMEDLLEQMLSELDRVVNF
ncbi:J domain-containing protein [Nostoc sp. 106C]|uniref:J domain-containing protein n=1 Tax=Nostoc sp. 106C TaxID=1932667 RepID=UPI000A39AD33|nr:J domain-containing protein [Nostoc sp. 106C]OUL20878.1 molecular chaperone DnaJ [Nostoc sp. RF31YmG]OUL22504.1 molecular chaperone DnaJ [Nostoc sp. 106C]